MNFIEINMFSILIFVILFFVSVYSWYIIISKRTRIINTRVDILNLEKSISSLEIDDNSELGRLFSRNLSLIKSNNYNTEQKSSIPEIELRRYFNDDFNGVEELGSIASLSPFIGLLGTVVGVITSFLSMQTDKIITLQEIGPGMAEALIATALGIFVAIPASYFYNKLSFMNEENEELAFDLFNLFAGAYSYDKK